MDAVKYIEEKFGPHKGNPHQLPGTEREQMYQLFAELGFTEGAELGVEKGKNARTMFEIIPNLHLYGVDPYKQHPQASYIYDAQIRKWDDRYLQAVKKQCLDRMQGRNFTLLEDFDEYAVDKIADNSLDFVYVDSDHSYDFVMLNLIKWGRKLKKGGIMSGHDYFYDKNTSGRRAKVTQAVNDYTKIHGIKFYITDENHFAGRKQNNGDYYPSWFFVKEDDIWPNIVGF
jgi:hypothetical protein